MGYPYPVSSHPPTRVLLIRHAESRPDPALPESEIAALENRGRKIAIASHGNAIALYLNSLDKTFGFQGWASMKTPDVFSVDYPSVGDPKWDRAFRIDGV